MKHEIEIEGLPEGWRAVAWRRLKNGDHYLNDKGEIVRNEALIIFALIVEKIKPRRIVLEETGEFRIPFHGEYYRKGLIDSPIEYCSHKELIDFAVKIWTVVEEDLRMKYISEEFLISCMKDPRAKDGILKILQAFLRECKELNQWQPIDESTPRDRRIVLLYEDGDVRVDWWHHESQQSDNKIVAWIEIPEPPK